MVGKAIKERRIELKMTQKALAEAAGISNITLNRIEKGVTKELSFKTAVGIAKALGVSVEFLLCGEC